MRRALVLAICGLVALACSLSGQEPVVPQQPPKTAPRQVPDTAAGKRVPTDLPPVKEGSPKKKTVQGGALFPVALVKNRLDNLAVGETAYIPTKAVKVDFERRCWLVPGILTGSKSLERVVRVNRDAVGYHVIIERDDHQWEAEEVTAANGYLPVASVEQR